MKKKLLILGVAVLAAVVLFAAVGFFAVPPLLRSQLEKLARAELQRELTIGGIELNPFDLKLEMRDVALKDRDGSRLLGFERLLVDYEIFPALTQRAFGFRQISLTRPLANAVIDKAGSLNFARLIEDATKNRPPDEAPKDEPLPRLIIDKLEVDRAGIEFTDERRAEPFSTQVDPVAVVLTDFNTLPDREGRQAVVARTPEGEQLKWEGEFGLSPIQSRGTVEVTGISGPKLWRYGEELVNFEIPSGTADVSAAYEVDLKQPVLRLHVTDMKAHLKGWALKSRNQEDRVLRLDDIEVGPGTFDLGERRLVLEKFVVAGGGLGAQRGSDNLINWVELLKLKGAAAAKETAAGAQVAAPGGDEGPWKIAIKDFRIANFGFAFSDDAAINPYDATVKRIELALAAVIDYHPAGSQIALDGIVVGLADVSLQPRDEPAPIFTLAAVELGTGRANYKDKTVEFDALKISKPRGDAWIDGAGKLNWAGLAPKTATAAGPSDRPAGEAAEPVKGAEQPWRIALKTVEVVEGGVTFTDRGMSPPVSVKVEPIRVKLDGVSSDLERSVGYDLDVGVQPGGQFVSKGSIVPATPGADGSLTLRDLPLKLGERYVNRFALLVLKSGAVSAAGKYAFAMRDGKPTAQFNGGFQVAKLDLVEEGTNERFLGWDLVDARGIDFKLEPTRLDILEVRLDRPAGKFIIYEDRTLNVQRVLRNAGGKGDAVGAAAQPAAEKTKGAAQPSGAEPGRQVGLESATSSVRFGAAPAAKPEAKRGLAPQSAALPFPVNIQRVRVNRGELFFADLTLTPQFGTRIHDLNGTVNNLSSRPNSRAQMKLEGAVDEYGLARFAGDLAPFAPIDYLNITATFRNVELTSMTPYSAKFAGYRIASGKLDADLEYVIQQRQLKGDNQIIVDQLTLGEKVESPDAVNLPLELGIALLKDADGKIDLGLPVSGSLDDPQFSIGGIIWKAVVNLLTKIVTAPFRALGALLGVGGEELEGIDFDPGSDVLLPPEKAKLGELASALEKRPQLKVGIRPVYATQDAEAIRSFRVRREIAKRVGFKLKEGEDPGLLDVTDPKNQDAIQTLFAERLGRDELAKVRDVAEKAQAGDGKTPLTKEAKEQMRAQIAETLLARLEAGEPVSEEELKALAQRRADAVAQEFAAQGKLPADRVAMQPVEKVDAAGKKTVESKFALVPQ